MTRGRRCRRPMLLQGLVMVATAFLARCDCWVKWMGS